jgi:DNA primase
MPDPHIVAYYERMAPTLLPFLAGRRVSLRQVFDGRPIFRRHTESGDWIHIADRDALMYWVQRDARAFFPELMGDDGTLWFALDVDRRRQPLAQAATVARAICTVLDERALPYLLKFSGADGFHVLWSFGPVTDETFAPLTAWEFERDVVRALRDRAEALLAANGMPGPLTTCDAHDRAHADLVLVDELILHHKASIRAPYALHERTGLVSVPVDPAALAAFVPPRDAAAATVVADGVSLPVNLPARVLDGH